MFITCFLVVVNIKRRMKIVYHLLLVVVNINKNEKNEKQTKNVDLSTATGRS